MNTISGMIERGRNITNNTVIPDYTKYLKKMKDEQRRSMEAEYFSKYQRILMKTEITIGFLKVAIAAKGEIVKQIKSGNKPSMKDFCVSRVLHHYETYKDFKKFVTLHDLNRNNQQTLLKEFEKEINAPRANAEDAEENQ
jgi:spore coat protein CotH